MRRPRAEFYCGKSCENRKDNLIDHRRNEKDNFALIDNNSVLAGKHAGSMNNAQRHGTARSKRVDMAYTCQFVARSSIYNNGISKNFTLVQKLI